MQDLDKNPNVALKPAEVELIRRESSFRPEAKNPKSTAFGLMQLLKGNREKYAKLVGVNPDTTDPIEQIAMGRKYIEDRYSTADEALRWHDSHNWY